MFCSQCTSSMVPVVGFPRFCARNCCNVRTMLCAATDIVPRKFKVSSGLAGQCFRVARTAERWKAVDSDPYPVLVRRSDIWEVKAIPVAKFPREVEAMTILAHVDGETERKVRYISVHSAYEAVVKDRQVELSALRHALAHPVTSLSRPSVRQALFAQFGDVRIDLTLHRHKAVYYRNIVAMLVAIDNALYETFCERWGELV